MIIYLFLITTNVLEFQAFNHCETFTKFIPIGFFNAKLDTPFLKMTNSRYQDR